MQVWKILQKWKQENTSAIDHKVQRRVRRQTRLESVNPECLGRYGYHWNEMWTGRGWFCREHSGQFQDCAVSIISITLQRTKRGREEKPSLDLLIGAESRSQGMSTWQESRNNKCKLSSPFKTFSRKKKQKLIQRMPKPGKTFMGVYKQKW